MPTVAKNPLDGFPQHADIPPTRIFSITGDDSNQLARATTWIWVDVAGAIKVSLAHDPANHAGVVLTVPARTMLRMCVRQVYATGTTATGIVGFSI